MKKKDEENNYQTCDVMSSISSENSFDETFCNK